MPVKKSKTKKSKRSTNKKKVKEHKKEEKSEEIEISSQNKIAEPWLEIGDDNSELSEDVLSVINPILDIKIDRFLKMKNSFAEVKDVFVVDDHFFHKVILDFVPFFFEKEKINLPLPSPQSLISHSRKLLLHASIKHFHIPSSVINEIEGRNASKMIYDFLQDQNTIQIPELKMNPLLFANDVSLRTPTLCSMLKDTFVRNSNIIDDIKPKLADNLTTKRQKLIDSLNPLEKDNEIIKKLLEKWDNPESIPLDDIDKNEVITLKESLLNRSDVYMESETFKKLIGCNCLETLSSKLVQSKYWASSSCEKLPDISDPILEPIQERAKRFRGFANNIENYLFTDNPENECLTPSGTMSIRLLSKEQVQTLFDLNKQIINDLSKLNEKDEIQEKTLIELKKEFSFIKNLLSHWKQRSKVCEKQCIWYLHLPNHIIARKDMIDGEVELFRSKLADLYLYIYEKEEEFHKIVTNQVKQLTGFFKLAMELDIISPKIQQEKLDFLLSHSKKIPEIPIDQFPSLSRSKRFMKNLEKIRTVNDKMNELKNTQGKIPSLQVRVDKIKKEFVDNLITSYKNELASSSNSKKNKAKNASLSQQVNLLTDLSSSWKTRSTWMKEKNIKTLNTLPRMVTLNQLSREELKALDNIKEAKIPSSLKKTKNLTQKKRTYEQPLKEAYDELVLNYKEQIPLLRSLVQGSNIEPPNIHFNLTAIQYLNLEQISNAQAISETVPFIISLWIQLSPYFTADEIRKYSHPQLKSFEKEFKLLDEHIESDISRIDNISNENDISLNQSKEYSLLNSLEKDGLLILTRGLEHLRTTCKVDSSNFLTLQDQNILLDFLQHMQDNSKLNSRTEEILKQDTIPFGISDEALKYCRTFTFKSRHLGSLHPFTVKLDTAWNKASNGEDNPKRSKVTLKELGILRTMEKWGKDLVKLFKLFQKENKHPMFKVMEDAVSAHHKLKEIYLEIQHRINNDNTYQSGDLLLTVWTKKLKTMQGNRPPAAFSFLMSFTKYEHTAVIYRNINDKLGPIGEPRLSHMYRQYHDSELTLEEIASSDIFRMWIPALVKDSTIREKLIQKLGDNWENLLQERYCMIESTLHSGQQDTLGEITNPLSRVMNIGTAAVMPWTRLRRTNMNFKEIRNTLKDNNPDNIQMTCSEFAAKSAIAAILELDEELIEELQLQDKIANAKNGCVVFNFPFHAKEKFKTMQPDRLRHLIDQEHALQKIPYPDFIEHLVQV